METAKPDNAFSKRIQDIIKEHQAIPKEIEEEEEEDDDDHNTTMFLDKMLATLENGVPNIKEKSLLYQAI